MKLNQVTPLAGSERQDSQMIKQWAAEDFAVAIGLLRECPYHGQPYRVDHSELASKAVAANLPDARTALQAFNGDRRELLSTAQRIARTYSPTCSACEAADHELFD